MGDTSDTPAAAATAAETLTSTFSFNDLKVFLHQTVQEIVTAIQSITQDDVQRCGFNMFFCIGVICIVTTLLPYIWSLFHFRQDLKKKYNATWALVTGGSSGIGLAITRKLAAQGLNVIVVAMPDKFMDTAIPALKQEFPHIQFIPVGVKLGSGDYLEQVARATAKYPVSLVFNNAGYMKTGFFYANDWQLHLDNINCNATASVALSHLFVRRMKEAGLKGCITFTSSPAGFMPSPFSCLYGATKAMLTHFATSLAGEVLLDGIDVSVLHPSPVKTAFYTGAHAMPTLQFFQSTGGSADGVADVLLRSIGRSVIIDQGYYPISLRFLQRIIDSAFLAEIIARTAHTVGDYKVLKDAAAASSGTPAGVTTADDAVSSSSVSKRRKSVSAGK